MGFVRTSYPLISRPMVRLGATVSRAALVLRRGGALNNLPRPIPDAEANTTIRMYRRFTFYFSNGFLKFYVSDD